MRPSEQQHGLRRRTGFTLVELLVVMAVIGLLVAIVVGVSAKISSGQKYRLTQNVMRSTGLAIDQFRNEDPLSSIYNSRSWRTWGNNVPYQLAGSSGTANTVANALEPSPAPTSQVPPTSLGARFTRDINQNVAKPMAMSSAPEDRRDDDIRALYTYLRVYNEAGLNQIPERYVHPLSVRPASGLDELGEYLTTGSSTGAAISIFGIHDAWDVPLDYFLYVKLEWGVRANGTVGLKVTDRVPVLRSWGISNEVYREQMKVYRSTNDPSRFDPQKWILSEPLPSPAAVVTNAGAFSPPATTSNGWARAVAAGHVDDCGYIPEFDP